MWIGVAVAGIFGGPGLRGGVASDELGAGKSYRVAAAGAVLASCALAYQYILALPH